jgi:hypothetical protein
VLLVPHLALRVITAAWLRPLALSDSPAATTASWACTCTLRVLTSVNRMLLLLNQHLLRLLLLPLLLQQLLLLLLQCPCLALFCSRQPGHGHSLCRSGCLLPSNLISCTGPRWGRADGQHGQADLRRLTGLHRRPLGDHLVS